MSLRLRWGLLATVVVVLGVSIILALGHVEVEQPLLERERVQLVHDLATAERLVSGGTGLDPDPARAALDLGELLGMRVTLVALDGRVLGDSGVPDGDVRNMTNHADRPEIRAALQGDTIGTARRFSATVGAELLYAATVTQFGGDPVILRLGLSLASFREGFAAQRRSVVLIGAGSLFLLLLGGLAIGGALRRSLSTLEQGVHGLTDGDFEALASIRPGPAEVRPLSTSLARMADEFEGRLGALERERAEVLALVDSIAEGVVALSDDARVLRMNRAARELLDVSRPPAFAPVGTLVRNPSLRAYLEASVVRPVAPEEFLVADRSLRVSAEPIDGGGSVVTILDVTELRRMEKIRRDFVANASHELKTPLTSMRGFAETLLEGDPPEDLRVEFLASIRKNTIRLQNLVDDLLDLSRLESGAWSIDPEPIEVAELAHEVWEEVGRGSSIRFSVHGDGTAEADARALHQIFQNLLDNALRFTAEDGRIDVTIEPVPADRLRIAVSDTGAGIPSSALPRIFERFYRADPGRDRGAGGTGLGLAIVRHLVQSMGGEVGASSVLGEGTTIHFTLPGAPPE